MRALLDRRALHLRRDLGQNFLIDSGQAGRLAQLAGVEAGDLVIEVGTGLGALTAELAARAARVVTIEIDAGLVRALREEALLPENVELVHADATRFDLGSLVSGAGGPVRVVANLPYSAATPLLRKLLDLRQSLEDWSVMLQREVAERVIGRCGTKDYGSLAVLHALTVEVERAAELSPKVFFPAPRVRSTFLRVTPLRDALLADGELARVERVVRAAFAQRRKTIRRALASASFCPSGDGLLGALARADIDPRDRAERIEPQRLLSLARALEGVPGERGAP